MLSQIPSQYQIAALMFVTSMAALFLLKKVLVLKLSAWAKKTGTRLDDIIIEGLQKISWPFFVSMPVYFSSLAVDLPEKVAKGVSTAALVILIIYGIKFLEGILNHLVTTLALAEEDEEANATIKGIVGISVKVVLWALGILLIAQNLNLKITALLGGLGIGGVAIAFALQATLGDLFSFFSIYFDKPFKIGDFLVIGEDMGTVERIGLKSTRLRTLQGEELVLSNSDLTNTRINNYRKMSSRRVSIDLGVEYKTTPEQMRKIPELVRDAVSKTELAEFDRAHFKSFGDFALIVEIVYFVNSSDYSEYMSAQQEINLAIMESFAKEGIEFAYPTQHLYIEKVN